MTLLGKLVPLVVLFVVLAFAAFVGYAAYTVATDIAEKTSKKMEKKNVSFGKDGMKIGVKEIKTENYVDQTQKYDGMIPLALEALAAIRAKAHSWPPIHYHCPGGLCGQEANTVYFSQSSRQGLELLELAGVQV